MTPSAVRPLVTDRRLWLFLLTAALSVVLGFYTITGAMAIGMASKIGYWFVLVAFGLWVRSLIGTFSEEVRTWEWRKLDWVSAGVVALGGLVLLVHETHGFKILMDEIMLLGTSMSMHFDRAALVPMRGNDIQGTFVVLDGMMDKRPLFFPFLVSLLHDLTGYRPANAFVLNGILAFAFLGMVNALGRRLAGRLGGWLGVSLFAGLPLLAHNANGGGFELLNLVMIMATLLLAVRYLEKRDGPALEALVLSALLLSQTRYESLVFILPVALVVLWVWIRERKVTLPWPVIAAPLLLIPYPLQHRVFQMRESSWEMFSRPGYDKPFSAAYVPENLVHAADFFFARPTDQPNSLLLSVMGWIALPFFLLLSVKALRAFREQTPAVLATVVFGIGFLVQFLLMMCYFWGKFDDPVIRRLSLPTHLWLVIAVLAVLPQLARAAAQRVLLGVAGFALIVQGVPSMAAHAYSQSYLPGLETAWRRQFIAAQERKDYLMIDNDSVLWLTHQVSATPVLQAIRRRESVLFHLRNRTFANIFVFQRFIIDPETSRMTLRDGDDLGPAYVLEPVREERLEMLTLSRISRVKEIREENDPPHPADAPEKEMPAMDGAEKERLRQAYFENFLRQLP